MPTCYAHPANPAPHMCGTCGRLLCDVCRFVVGFESRCPDCLSSAGARRSPPRSGAWSLALAGAGVVATLLVFVTAAVTPGEDGLVGVLFLIPVATATAGIVVGLTSRGGPGKPMPVMGIVGTALNSLLLAMFLVLICVGVASGE